MLLFHLVTPALLISSFNGRHPSTESRSLPITTMYGVVVPTRQTSKLMHDTTMFKGVVVPARQPSFFACWDRKGVHYILHRDDKVFGCEWTQAVTYQQKINILHQVQKYYVTLTNRTLGATLTNYYDLKVWSEATRISSD